MIWHEKTSEQVLEELQTDQHYGLKDKDVLERHKRYGMNALAEKKKTNIIIRFFMQFNDFMIFILLIAAGVSFVVSLMEGKQDFLDPIIILMIISLNAILGLTQENKAEKALEALKKMTAPTAKVIRNGHLSNYKTETLVPGDIILLEAGDFVPADARVIVSHNLKAEESALTGESLPVEKEADIILSGHIPVGDKKNMLFSGSCISYGRGTAVIVETGMNTEVGRIASMIIGDEAPETPLQKKLAETSKILGIGAVIICIIIFMMGVLRKISIFEMFMTSVSLAVAAIPEGLPAIVTIMLAIGVQRMAKRSAVIRKLPAVETLGSANVICSDKTGTLTQNKMKVVEVSDGLGKLNRLDKTRKQILKLGSLCSDCIIEEGEENSETTVLGDPTETSIVYAALELGLDKRSLDTDMERVSEIPFDSKRKLMSTIHKNKDRGYIIITKGAPDVLLDRCSFYSENGDVTKLTDAKRNKITHTNSSMADKALRVIGIAYSEVTSVPIKAESSNIEKELVFAGLIGMIDPPRDEVAHAVAVCKRAGIKPVMVTGDHVATATAIAKKIGIMESDGKAMTGEELNKIPQKDLEDEIYDYSVFARVSPEHKMRIVKAFQKRGAVVAMTGDGVNDAPALKAADIGCAMGISGTDVAKGAADMVLTDDNFATIVDAVKEGRGIYANIRKAVHFLLSSNIGEIVTIFLAILLGWNTPLLAIHLLWVNLVTDSLPAIALGLDPAEKDIMNKKGIDNHKSLFSDGLWQRIALEGFMIGFLALIAFGVGVLYFDIEGSYAIGRTMAFATLSISELVHAFNMRSDKSLFSINIFENQYLVGAFIVGIFLQVSVIMLEPLAKIFRVTPLSLVCWIIVTGLCTMPLILVELEKFFAKNADKTDEEFSKLKELTVIAETVVED